MFNFVRNCQAVFQSGCKILHYQQQCMRVHHTQTSKQNITRDIEIKNKLTVTRGAGERDNGGKQGQDNQGTGIKDTWTKLKGVGSRVGGGDVWGGGGRGGVKMEKTVLKQ